MANLSWIGPVAQAASDLVSNMVNKFSKLSKNEKYNAIWYANQNYKYSQMAANADYARNLSMWRMNNEYNSPAAQMQRYKDAGLNPNLIYGQSNTASAPSMSHSSAPSLPVDTHEFTLGNYHGDALQQMLSALDDDSTENVARDDAKQILRYHEAQASSAESQSAIDSFNAQMVQEKYKNALEDRNIENNKKLAEIKNLNSRTGLSDEQKAYYNQQIDYLKSQIKVNNARIKNLDENSELANTQAALNRQAGVHRENAELRAEEDHAFIEWKRNFETMDDQAREEVINRATDGFCKTFFPNATKQDKKIIHSVLRQSGKLLYNVLDGLFDVVK